MLVRYLATVYSCATKFSQHKYNLRRWPLLATQLRNNRRASCPSRRFVHYQPRCFAFSSPSATLSPPARRIPCPSACRIASTSPQNDLPHLGRTRRSQKHASASRPQSSTKSSSGRAGLVHPHLHVGRPYAIGPRPLHLARSPATPPARMTNPPATSPATSPATRPLVRGIAAAITHCRAIPSPASTPRTNITAATAARRAHPHQSPVRASAQSPATLPATLPLTPMILRIGSTAQHGWGWRSLRVRHPQPPPHKRCHDSQPPPREHHRRSHRHRGTPWLSAAACGPGSSFITWSTTPSPRLLRRIRRGKYVDFAKLLTPLQVPAVFQQPPLQWPAVNASKDAKSASKCPQCTVTDLVSWLEAWNIYLAVRLDTHPHMAQELTKYQSIVSCLFVAYRPEACD